MATLSEISVGDTVSWSIPKDPDPPSVVHGVITSIIQKRKLQICVYGQLMMMVHMIKQIEL